MAKATISKNKVLGIDIGGTAIKAAPVDIEKGNLLAKIIKISTPQPSTPDAVFQNIERIIKEFSWQGAIGCGFPGIVKKGVVLSAANVDKKWINFEAAAILKKLTGVSVNFINDADAASLAEMNFGAGRPYNHEGGGVVLMITLGTGIGSGLFVNGHLVPNTEFGHIEIGGVVAEKQAATVVKEREGLSWEAWSERVNCYLQKMEFLLSPDVFIIGGGVSESSEKFFHYLKVNARLVPAEMKNDAGIVGAALAVNNWA